MWSQAWVVGLGVQGRWHARGHRRARGVGGAHEGRLANLVGWLVKVHIGSLVGFGA
jgi:hypothetical protein